MARHPELEAAIFADPDRVESYLVYGDWLEREGDPRGELIAIQGRRLERPADAALAAAEDAFVKANRKHLLGDLSKIRRRDLHVEWRLGFISLVRVHDPKHLKKILRAAPLLREIEVFWDDFDDVTQELAPLRGFAPHTVRAVRLWTGTMPVGDLAELAKTFPNLNEVLLEGDWELGPTSVLPELRAFTHHREFAEEDTIKQIMDGRWRKLTQLSLRLEEGVPADGVDDLQPMLDGKHFPDLRRLGLGLGNLDSILAEPVGRAAIVPQLERLWLGGADGEVLENFRARMAHIRVGRIERLHNPSPSHYERYVEAELLWHMGRHERAAKMCEAIIKDNFPGTWAHHALVIYGLSLRHLGRLEEALDAEIRALSSGHAEECWAAWNNRGFILAHMGQWEQARDCVEQAFKLEPNESSIARMQALCLKRLGHDADSAIQRALALTRVELDATPDAVDARYCMAAVMCLLDQETQARETLAWVLERDPSYEDVIAIDPFFESLRD